MTEQDELQRKRFIELARKSENAAYFIFTDFLGLGEQTIFSSAKAAFGNIPYKEFGGASGTERLMIRFGDEEELGYSEPFPISIIKVAPRSEKFAERLTHRDFLGALLNLGIERDKLGDIVIKDGTAYVFVSSGLEDYIISSLTRVRHTDVIARQVEQLPEGELYQKKALQIQLQSERIDAAVAKVFSMSRDDSLSLFRRGLVFLNGVECESPTKTPHVGDVISVRGHGRFIYFGATSLSKKGKLNVKVEVYI